MPKPVARGGPQSVGRILTILESLANVSHGATLTELSDSTGAPKTSLVGLLAGLTEEGCLTRDEGGRYFLGSRFLSLAMRAVAGRELSTLVRPILVDLVAATGETVVLGALAPDADEATYLDKIESSNPIRYAVTVGERRELYCTAVGKSLLAWFDEDRLDAYLKATQRTQFTDQTITGTRELLAELAQIRQDGLARSYGERVTGACAIAAPIFAGDGAVVATLLVAGPTERMQANAAAHEIKLRKAADKCTRLAGGTPENPES
ncbi:MAG: IclR family transcriptional regulator [Alphaproteobacteria bacterium]|nr:IclR family transcriptional regulator [Alphaproteobacteria bacterium]MBT4019052.1 IclR family transcriptional regulator [Alphaproteobacteria bacterium]MBT4966494.1 IclR family transcriptional regulator [Alphaproteobacteria bacterium]MBT5159070.1 IclR family transcriptional regulator [Alphaproteobacteria bacterium]MBT5919912.1 IclR family transcriptional regulator [Alphaproteobacteria bacterium]